MSAERGAPAISVVVPTVGRPGFLERCLAALARSEMQSKQFEVVVVDDSGDPEIERVAAAADLKPRVVKPKRSGPSGARNAGAAVTRGRLIAFTDDDCEPRPGWLAALERVHAADPEAAIGGVTVNGVPGNAGAVASQAVVDAVHAQFNRDSQAPRFFASSNVAFPAGEFSAFGGFNEDFRYAEDREVCERWLRTGHRFAFAPDAVVVHMRTLTLREFWRQHHGYGRGAFAFAHSRGSGTGGDRRGVVREIASAARRGDALLAALLALSQVATASGYAREAVAARVGARGG